MPKSKVKVPDTGIYTLDANKKDKPLKQSKIIYTILGSQNDFHDEYPILTQKNADQLDEAYAKHEIVGEIETYYIKIDSSGHLCNPMALLPNNSHKFKVMKNNEKSWQYSKVNKECFQHYITMLKTRNVLHYRFSERAR